MTRGREKRKEERITLENRPLHCKIILEEEQPLYSIIQDINNKGVKLKCEEKPLLI